MELGSGTIAAEGSSSKTQKNSIKKAKERRKVCVPYRIIPWLFSEFRQDTQLCDGIIICEDNVELKVHTVILSSVSSYFKAHFTNTSNRASEILEAKVNVPSHIFTKLLDFAYMGDCTIEEENVELLLRAADQYDVMGVVQLCCKYILDRLQPTNCLRIVRFARQHFFSDLEKEGKGYVMHNFIKLLNEGDEFDKLTVEEVVEILEDDYLNVRNEGFVYNAVRRWINVNPGERKVHLLSLLKCVRIGKLSIEFLTEHVLAWSLVAENVDCQTYVMEIMHLMHTTKNNLNIDNVVWRPRVPYDILFAIGGSSTNCIETYDARADRWLLSVDSDSVSLAFHGLAALNGYIYVIGGFDSTGYLSTVERFHPVTHEWSECACMYYPRCHVSVVMHDNKIYAMGGHNGTTEMNSAERYDPRYNQWELIEPMQKQRSSAGAAVLNDKIYIVGGLNYEIMSSAEVYDTFSDQWTFIPPMLSPRSGVSLVALKNKIYALGGRKGRNGIDILTTGEKFTPGVSPGWEAIQEMSRPRSDFATVILDDQIFVLGGASDRFAAGFTTINSVECYNTDTNEWMHASPMNMDRIGHKACVISSLPNARDYSLKGRNRTGSWNPLIHFGRLIIGGGRFSVLLRWLQDKFKELKEFF